MSKPLPTRPEPAQPAEKGEKKSAAPAPPPKPKAPKKPSPWPWGPWIRAGASLMIAFHVVAVFSAPWFIQLADVEEPPLPPGRPWLMEDGRVVRLDQLDRRRHPPLRPRVPEALAGPLSSFPLIYHYANALYINNGYDFFSPDPTGSFILKYQVLDSMGQSIKEGQFPDRDSQWPRLLYHRYMMLADQSAAATQEQGAVWMQKVADRLLTRYHGASVKLTSVRHHLLTPDEVLAGRRLDEASTYQVLNEGTFVASLPNPAKTDASGAPQGATQ